MTWCIIIVIVTVTIIVAIVIVANWGLDLALTPDPKPKFTVSTSNPKSDPLKHKFLFEYDHKVQKPRSLKKEKLRNMPFNA